LDGRLGTGGGGVEQGRQQQAGQAGTWVHGRVPGGNKPDCRGGSVNKWCAGAAN